MGDESERASGFSGYIGKSDSSQNDFTQLNIFRYCSMLNKSCMPIN